MQILHTYYTELPASLEIVRATLRCSSFWAELLAGCERLGQFWRWNNELYDLVLHEDEDSLVWTASPATGIGPCLRINVVLSDAVVITHAAISTTVDISAMPWQRTTLRQQLERGVRDGVTVLVARLEQTHIEPQRHRDTESQDVLLWSAAAVLPPDGSTVAALQTSAPVDLAAPLRPRYPHTVAAFEAMGALDHLQRVWQLEQGWARIARGEYDRSCYEAEDKHSGGQFLRDCPTPVYDLIYAGGGLGLLHAAVMARRYGWRVMVFDRGEVGCAHREWNISRKELAALVELGLATWDELAPIIMTEYRTGLVRFYDSPENHSTQHDLWLPGVLDVALDAGALLQLARRKLEEVGGVILDHRAFQRVVVQHNRFSTEAQRRREDACDETGSFSVRVELKDLGTGDSEQFSGRLLLDGMGSTSPLALLRHAGHPFAGVCPTVGTVAEGFAQDGGPQSHDPTLGDILVSVADTQHGQQLMWEGFPGRGDELTVYLFYYDTVGDRRPRTVDRGQEVWETRPDTGTWKVAEAVAKEHSPFQYRSSVLGPQSSVLGPPHSLLALFEDYFALLPTYKRPGPSFRHLKPVYGYIPARHSLQRQEAPLLRGVLPVGDSAAQQSPLTFCGFGSHVRNLGRTTSLLDYALRQGLTEPQHLSHISAFQVNVSLNWVFSRFMHPWGRPNDVNQLQNIFLGVLNDLGPALATRFFQDRMRWSDYHKMVLGMFARHKPIVGIAWRVLGPTGVRQWIADYLRFSTQAVYATLGRVLGTRGERLVTKICDHLAPSLALQVRAHYAEWRAMGWE